MVGLAQSAGQDRNHVLYYKVAAVYLPSSITYWHELEMLDYNDFFLNSTVTKLSRLQISREPWASRDFRLRVKFFRLWKSSSKEIQEAVHARTDCRRWHFSSMRFSDWNNQHATTQGDALVLKGLILLKLTLGTFTMWWSRKEQRSGTLI